MRAVRSFLHFWYDFVIGDDATIAVGVVLALAATAILARYHVPTWWLLPAAAIVLLALSLARARHDQRQRCQRRSTAALAAEPDREQPR